MARGLCYKTFYGHNCCPRVFATSIHFHPSLIFVGKAIRAYHLSGVPQGPPLVYYDMATIMTVKSYTEQTQISTKHLTKKITINF